MGMTAAVPTPRTVVLVLLLGEQARERVRLAVRDLAELVVVTRVAEAQRWLSSSDETPALMIVEPEDADGVSTMPLVRRVAQSPHSFPVVGYCSMHPGNRRELLALAQCGVHDVVFAEVDDSAFSIREILAQATQTCGAEVVLGRLQPSLPDAVRPLITYCLAYPERASSVADVALALGVNRRTLVNITQRCSFPPPQEILTWCRLLLAAYLMDASPVTLERIALRVDFPTAGAMRNACARYVGASPGALREKGAMDLVLRAFQSALRG